MNQNLYIMNYFKVKLFISTSLLLLLFLSAEAQIKEAEWNYPVHPGTEQWNELDSFSERLNAFNIPEGILSEMSTENLVKTCLSYPWWILITSRDNNQAGYNYLKSVFNGFRELENRQDSGIELLKVYGKMMPESVMNFESLVKQGMYCFQFTFIEILLSQPDILKNSEDEYSKTLVQKTISVYEGKTVAFDKYSYYGVSSTCLILARVLRMNSYPDYIRLLEKYPELKRLDETGTSGNLELLEQIVVAAKRILN